MKKPNNEKLDAGILHDEEKKRLVEDRLAGEIAEKYKISKNEALRLIENNTSMSLDELKEQIGNTNNKLGKKELEELFLTLKGANEVIENLSKIKIEMLKDELGNNNAFGKNETLDKIFPSKLVDKAKNPNKLHEHILGITLGSAYSMISIVEALYQIGAGIIKAPRDIYLVVSGKAELEGLKEI